MMSKSDAPPVVLLAVESLDPAVVGSLSRLTGWNAVPIAGDAELVDAYRDTVPDAVVVDASRFDALVLRLLAIRRRPVVCVGPDDWPLARVALDAGAAGWVTAPPSPTALAAAVASAVRSFSLIETLAAEKAALAQTLETRKLVERAKSIFMRRLKLDEATAHKRLQQESQNRRISLADLARRIIESEEMMTEKEGNSPQKTA